MTLEGLADDPRVMIRRPGQPDASGAAVVYWMQRAQRAVDNPALDLAIAAANEMGKPVIVFFGLNPFIVRANARHYQFLAEGLDDIAVGLRRRRVGFVLRRYPRHRLLPFLQEVKPALVIGDENPLRQTERWRDQVAEQIDVPLWTVDADVVVPAALLEKEQYAARTIRPRLHKVLDEFLVGSREPKARASWQAPRALERGEDPRGIVDGLPIDRSVPAVNGVRGGTAAARTQLRRFVKNLLPQYDGDRNHPERDGTSGLSPYLHFGQIGPREVALAIRDSGAPRRSVEAFLEQLIVRRELGVNFVRFNDAYDSLDGCERWARQTLRRHRLDRREHLYSADEFEQAATHDPLWNAAQRQMVATGWMHGYMRMYWAKKILEWSADPADALETAIRLNDRYEIDGRDPSGYANIAWAIGGKHDRPWPERRVYGKIRSMSFDSTRRKFDAAAYVDEHGSSDDQAAYRDATRRPSAARRNG